ncbi:MAG: alpha/beta hydrolase [Spirulina sp.]
MLDPASVVTVLSFLHLRFIDRSSAARWQVKSALGFALVMAGLTWGQGAMAADFLTLRWGMVSKTIRVDDLETFATTGEIPDRLWLYRPLLNANVQATLQNELVVDPAVGQVILDEILHTPGGTPLLATLQALVPNLKPTDLQQALEQVASQGGRPTLMAVLRQLPQETLEVDVGAWLAWASQFQLAQQESTLLGQILRREMVSSAAEVWPPSSVNPFSTGPAEVERWEMLLRDRHRNRSIPVDIYWSRSTHGPLVVLSHGFGADRRFLAYLAEHLASHGLTVVAVEHPGSNVTALLSLPKAGDRSASQGSRVLPATEFLDRPRDISYVLDRLERINRYSYSLRGRLNTDQVTLVGHSLGGYTGLALAGAPLDLRLLDQACQQMNPVRLSPSDWFQCAALDLPVKYANLRDPRIRQLILTNPLTGLLFGEAGLSQVQVPTLMLASTQDGVTPMAAQQLGPFTQLAGPKYLITALGGSHLSVGDPDNLNPNLQAIPFMPALPDAKTSNLRVFLQGISLSFILQQTDQAESYGGFLSPRYAEVFSTPELALGLNQTLPPQLLRWPRLQHQTHYQQASRLSYGQSLLRLQSMLWQDQVHLLHRQMITYLRAPLPLAAFPYSAQPWPMQANYPDGKPPTP